jgi:hypothetical protein
VSSSGSSGSASDDEVYVTISPAASYTVSAKAQAKSPEAGEAERQQAAAAAADAADSAREQHDVFNLVALVRGIGIMCHVALRRLCPILVSDILTQFSFTRPPS